MAEVISRSGKEVTVAVTVRLAGSLWEMKEAIQEGDQRGRLLRHGGGAEAL